MPNESSSSQTTLPPIPLHLAVNIRLSKSNYLLWRAQLMPFLWSTKLIGYLDGTISTPAKTTASSMAANTEQVPNPAYEGWQDQDQQLLSGLLSSMTEDILRDVVSAKMAKEVWDSLQKKFSSSMSARTVQIRVELATAKKHTSSVEDYFHKITGLAAELAAADAPLRDDEVIACLLDGLDPESGPFVTSVTTKTEALSLDDVYAYLMAFEAWLLQHHTELQLPNNVSSVNYARRGGSPRGHGHGIVVVAILEVVYPPDWLTIVATDAAIQAVLPTRSVAR
jgi:hypothetical protein